MQDIAEGSMDDRMAGRVCLVTGATRGIGRAIAQTLAARGATVVLVARGPTAGEIVAADLQQATGNRQASAPATVLNVTAPSSTRPDFADLQGERSFRALWQFGATKMETLLFTFALARRLEGSGVTANAVHPGVARTDLMRETPMPFRLFTGLLNRLAPLPTRAAEDVVGLVSGKAATANGQFFHRGQNINPPDYARDQAAQERLWQAGLELCGLEGS